jgi:hypothetical protein
MLKQMKFNSKLASGQQRQLQGGDRKYIYNKVVRESAASALLNYKVQLFNHITQH